MKTRIAVDLDGVVCIHYDRTIDLLNRRYQTDVHPQEMNEYRFEQYWIEHHGTREGREPILYQEIRRFLLDLFADDAYLATAAVSLPMVRTLRELSGMSRDPSGVTILTARHPSTAIITRAYLDQFGIAYHAIAHEPDKARYCTLHKIQYIVEDAPHHAEACQRAGIGVFLIDAPYNRAVEATGVNGIWRVANPLEIPDLIRMDFR